MELGREDLSLARLAEAHYDAVAILAEAGREALSNTVYGVWASEKPSEELLLSELEDEFRISGKKMFCSGAGIIDHALVTVGGSDTLLFDVDLKANLCSLKYDNSEWHTAAFEKTGTSTVSFHDVRVFRHSLLGDPGWYLNRPGFWHRACGPAACWAGGAAGLVDYALKQPRSDAHTLAHLGAMYASLWALRSFLGVAGDEIDAAANDLEGGHVRALTVRHLVEQSCSEVLRRLPRAYGPRPLAMDAAISRRYQELDLYIRQSHAERDLEALAQAILRNKLKL
jgi:alkylation response protein AidB-like acyl-CoA dehydrogenase